MVWTPGGLYEVWACRSSCSPPGHTHYALPHCITSWLFYAHPPGLSSDDRSLCQDPQEPRHTILRDLQIEPSTQSFPLSITTAHFHIHPCKCHQYTKSQSRPPARQVVPTFCEPLLPCFSGDPLLSSAQAPCFALLSPAEGYF